MMLRLPLALLLLPVPVSTLVPVPTPALAQPAQVEARTIVARAFQAAGGERWAKARTLELKGRAVFYGAGPSPRAVADNYRMWREFEDVRSSAHGEAGKVRIEARTGERLMFIVGSDGAVSFNEKGIIPKPEADRFWANNFGFGVIRSALGPGFKLERLPDDEVGGHVAYMVRVTDPAGTATVFGIDKASHFIRLAGFATPSGWHVRTYDDFAVADGWTQARTVTLYYNGVIANQVYWTDWKVNAPAVATLFQPLSTSDAPG